MSDRLSLVVTALTALPALFNRQVLTDIRRVQQTGQVSSSRVIVEGVGITRRTAEGMSQGWQLEFVTLEGEHIPVVPALTSED